MTPAARSAIRAIALLLAIAAPFAMSSFAMTIATSALVFAMFATSLNLVLGHAGLPSLGHAAFFGAGAYTVAILAQHGTNNFITTAIAATLAGGILGLLLGPALLRTRGTYFLMATLAVSQVMWNLAISWRSVTHGDDGLFGIAAAPMFGIDLTQGTTFYYILLAALVALLLLINMLMQAPFGHTLRALRDNRGRMAVLGVHPFTIELIAFVISAALAGFAGAMYAHAKGFVAPGVFSIETSAQALLMVVLGGAGTLFGPVIGAVVIAFISGIGSTYTQRWLTVLGLISVLVALDLPAIVRRRWPRRTQTEANPPQPTTFVKSPSPRIHNSTDPTTILAADTIEMHFAGVSVLDGISLAIAPGERRGLIGPNGAGKTTFLNILSGIQRPSGGRILFDGRDITKLPAHRRARLGIGRTFQIGNLFDACTIRENIVLALIARDNHGLRFVRNLSRYANLQAEATNLLTTWHLDTRHAIAVKHLSYGERRVVEIVLALAGRPKILLLDEPAAGLSGAETTMIIQTISALDPTLAILLVEHDMDLVFAICDRVTVIAAGHVLAEAAGDDVRRDPHVIEAYLGMPL